jgi:hypothetical protein
MNGRNGSSCGINFFEAIQIKMSVIENGFLKSANSQFRPLCDIQVAEELWSRAAGLSYEVD